MPAWSRDPVILLALLTIHVTAMIVVVGFVAGWWSSGSDRSASLAPASDGIADGPGVDGPTVTLTPGGSLFLITATPGSLSEVTPTPEPPPPAPPTPASAPPTNTPPPPATDTPVSAPSPAAPAAGPADFSGTWRIVDVVTAGSNAGQIYTFDVSLLQQGNRVFGGNSGIRIDGVVQGDTATVQYVQPALGYTGTFVWTRTSPDQASGTFTNSYPNSGTSTLQRLQ